MSDRFSTPAQGGERPDPEQLLRQELTRRGDALDEAPIGLGDVRQRARAIRRRRQGTTLLAAAAAVLVVALPVGLALDGSSDRGGPGPAAPASSSSAPPSPDEPVTATLDLTDLPTGEEPEVPWIQGRELHTGEGTLTTEERYADVVRLGDEVVAQQLGDGNRGRVDVLDADGAVQASFPSGYSRLVTNAEQTVVAWVDTAGRPRFYEPGMSNAGIGSIAPRGTNPQVVAVTGDDCGADPANFHYGCSLWVVTDSRRGRFSWLWLSVDAWERARPVGQALLDVDVVDDQQQVLALVRPTDDMAWCSEYRDEEQRRWETCDHMPQSFSPDHHHVLATGPIGFEGFGIGRFDVLHTESGEPVLTVETGSGDRGATITDMAWEDEEHVLAKVYQNRQWALVRVGLDGSVEYAAGPVRGTDLESPLSFGSQP